MLVKKQTLLPGKSVRPGFSGSGFSLINCDALEMFGGIGDKSVDLCVTDPPYRVISGGNSTGRYSGGVLAASDGKIFKHNDIKAMEWMPEVYRVLRTDAHFYCFVNNLNLQYFLECGKASGFKFHNLLIWNKRNKQPSRWYMKSAELVLMFYKGKAFPINNMSSPQIFEYPNPRTKIHPTEKPVNLIQHYIENSSQIGELVLDPFLGSGTAAEASLRAGRGIVGSEIDPAYYDTTVRRVKRWLKTKTTETTPSFSTTSGRNSNSS